MNNTNDISRTIIRFTTILISIILIVFLSIALFKFIPIGINQLATSSLSLGNLNSNTSATSSNTTSQPIATTTGGLNGVVTKNLGNLTINESKTTVTPAKNNTKIVYVEKPVYYPQNINFTQSSTGLKNINIALTSTGIIDRYTGQFIATNSFNRNDMVSVKYRIFNDQDTATGPFSMRVDMPALNSNDQVKYINNINIPARSSYDVEARFDGINTLNNAVVKIYTDINNQVYETNESDNNLFVTLNNVIDTNNNYCNNYNYYNNCYNNLGNANLSITSIQTGKFINGVFFAQNNFNQGDTVTVKLRVRNTGASFTNTWSTRTTYYENNGNGNFREKTTNGERYLSSGEETTLTYNIDNLTRGNTVLNIQIDSNNNIFETNENDNSTSVNVYVY